MSFATARFPFLLLALLFALPLQAQRVQIIHNAPDPAADTVDVSFLGLSDTMPTLRVIEDVPFREATAFLDFQPGQYAVSVSNDSLEDDIVENQSITLEAGETYQIIVGGVADPAGFQANPNGEDIAAELFVNTMARETSDNPNQVRFNIAHGATDAPRIDVLESGRLFANDLLYGSITGYASVAGTRYVLDVTNSSGALTIGTFVADFSDLDGLAFSLLASGFVTPEDEDDTNGTPAAFGLLAVLPDGTTFLLPEEEGGAITIAEARDLPLGSTVTVEGVVTRAMGDFTRIQDDTAGLTIRQTSGPFKEAVADGTIAPGTVLRVTGQTSEFASLFQINEQLDAENDYEVLGTDELPVAQVLTLEEIGQNGEAYESELVQVVNLQLVPAGDTEFQPATTYDISDKTSSDSTVALRVPNADDTELDGEPLPVSLFDFSGVLSQFDFDDPVAGYQLLPVQETDIARQDVLEATLQIIHNAPDPAFDEVDVYVNGVLFEDDLAFRTATQFTGVPSDIDLEVAIAPGDSDSADDAIFTETYNLSGQLPYQLIATGVGEGDFEPNPDGEDIAFTLVFNSTAQLVSTVEDNVELNFVHGTPDAPAVDVRTGTTQSVILFNDVPYGGQAEYQPIGPGMLTLEVTTADGVTSVGMFELDLSGRENQAGTVLASGFLTPENEDDTNGEPPSFGLLLTFADGSEAFAEPVTTANEGGAALPAAFALRGAYPNPFADRTTVRFDLPADARVGMELYDVLGRRVLSLAPQAMGAGVGRTLGLDAVLPSGVYLYRLTAETAGETLAETGRMTVVR